MDVNKKLKINRRCKNVGVDCETSIFRLNDDCVRYIFSFLPIEQRIQIQRVCKRWQRISKLPWSDVKELDASDCRFCIVHATKFKLNVRILEQILNLCGSSITHIKLPLFHIITGIELLVLIKNMCPSLRAIDFKGVTITPKVAQFLAENFNALTKITIKMYWPESEDSLSQFFAYNKCLKYLDIQSNEKNVGTYFSKLPESLNEIVIRYAVDIHPDHLFNGFQRLSNLRSLTMDSCSLDVLQKFDSFIDALPNKMNLEELQLSYVLTTETRSLIHVKSITQLTNLRKLVLKGVFLIQDETLINVGTCCKNLRIVHLYDSSNELREGWSSFIAGLNLEELKIADFDRLPDQCFASMNMPSLKILKCYRCFQFSAETFGNLVRKMDHLERLDVIFCGVFSFKKSYNETLIKNVLASLKTRKNKKTLELHVLNQKAVRNVRKIFSLTLVKEKDYNHQSG